MTKNRPAPLPATRPAFALVEAVVCALVVAVLLAVFALAGADNRRNASLSGSISNLKQFAWAGSAYTADCSDRFWTFSWTRLDHPPGFSFASDQDAAIGQATNIIQRRALPSFTTPVNWLPHISYSSLVLADQLNMDLPIPWLVSPMDPWRPTWQQCLDAPNPSGCFLALPISRRPQEQSNNDTLRWMFSSSYQLGPAFISRDTREGSQTTVQSSLSNHYNYDVGSLPLGDRLMTQVVYPSRKAMLWDTYQRHFGRNLYYAYPECRLPILQADGAALVRATSESNQGAYPNLPTNPAPIRFNYVPRPWEYPTRSGTASELVTGYYQWTRGGLRGRDFGDVEVCTGQPDCTP